MATPEGKVKGWLKAMLKAEGVFHYSPQAGPYGVAGISDVVCIVCGLFVAVECKADASKKMTALQERFMEQVLAAGGYHFLVYDKETIEEVRRFIHNVRTRRSRQKGSSGSVPQQGQHSVCNTDSKTGEGELGPCPPPARGNNSAPEPRIYGAGADPLLLQLAGTAQTNVPSADNSFLSN